MKNQVKGLFDVILADPPWDCGGQAIPPSTKQKGFNQKQHYPVMKTRDICNLEIPAKKDHCVLFLWIPVYILERGLRVMKAWGFKYKSQMIWAKLGGLDKTNFSKYFKVNHEILLFGTRGKSLMPKWENRPLSILHESRGRHSEKPKKIHNLIQEMYPNKRYLELFAREHREGWTVWGNEV